MLFVIRFGLIAFAALLPAALALGQSTCQPEYDRCMSSCGQVMVPDPAGGMSLALDPNCQGRCQGGFNHCRAAETGAAQQRMQQEEKTRRQAGQAFDAAKRKQAEQQRQEALRYQEQQQRADEAGRRATQQALSDASRNQQLQQCFRDCNQWTVNCVNSAPWPQNQDNCNRQGNHCTSKCQKDPNYFALSTPMPDFLVIPDPRAAR
jgi:hypothetical protein